MPALPTFALTNALATLRTSRQRGGASPERLGDGQRSDEHRSHRNERDSDRYRDATKTLHDFASLEPALSRCQSIRGVVSFGKIGLHPHRAAAFHNQFGGRYEAAARNAHPDDGDDFGRGPVAGSAYLRHSAQSRRQARPHGTGAARARRQARLDRNLERAEPRLPPRPRQCAGVGRRPPPSASTEPRG